MLQLKEVYGVDGRLLHHIPALPADPTDAAAADILGDHMVFSRIDRLMKVL